MKRLYFVGTHGRVSLFGRDVSVKRLYLETFRETSLLAGKGGVEPPNVRRFQIGQRVCRCSHIVAAYPFSGLSSRAVAGFYF